MNWNTIIGQMPGGKEHQILVLDDKGIYHLGYREGDKLVIYKLDMRGEGYEKMDEAGTTSLTQLWSILDLKFAVQWTQLR